MSSFNALGSSATRPPPKIRPITLSSESCRMNRTDRCAATEAKGRVLEAASTVQDVQDPAENAHLIRSSCAAPCEYDAGAVLGRRQTGCGKWSHPPGASHEAEHAPQLWPPVPTSGFTSSIEEKFRPGCLNPI